MIASHSVLIFFFPVIGLTVVAPSGESNLKELCRDLRYSTPPGSDARQRSGGLADRTEANDEISSPNHSNSMFGTDFARSPGENIRKCQSVSPSEKKYKIFAKHAPRNSITSYGKRLLSLSSVVRSFLVFSSSAHLFPLYVDF